MRSRTLVMAAVVLAVVFVVSSMAIARGHGRSAKGHFDGPVGLGAVMALNLSDSQKDKAIKIEEEYKISRIKARGELMKKYDDLRVALQADKINEHNIRKTYKKLSLTREDMLIAQAKMMTEMKSILTPEQLKLWDERKIERPRRGREYADPMGQGHNKWYPDCPRW
ncbi:MAG: Spy/CpxP family protein refolding chaperone [Thermodesulfobacteriota bacterium]|nr:Spy/CpxP family protein refolding chaperone [Thermodesulfobacteriota bacterium]